MADVICDTSFLIILASKPLRNLEAMQSTLGKVDLVVPSVVIEELKNLATTAGPKRAGEARLALEVAGACRVVVLEGGSADEAIMDYAMKRRCYVATVDSAMMKKLTGRGIGVVTLANDRITIV